MIAIHYVVGSFHLDVEIELGGWVAIFGPSGSGKTTLLECVAGLRRPRGGRIAVDGRVLFDGSVSLPPRARRVGYVSQDGDLFPHLTVQQNLRFGLRDGIDFDEVSRILELDDLLERRPRQLSGGQRQRVALGRALLSAPSILLLDEPLSSLDHALRRRVIGYFTRVKRRFASTPCLYVTHSVGEVLALADRVVLLEAGAVVGSGAPSAVLSSVGLAKHIEDGIESVVELKVVAHLEREGVTQLDLGRGHALTVPLQDAAIGSTVRVALRADDVILALGDAPAMSAQNIIPARVEEIVERPHELYVRTTVGDAVTVWSHITPAARHRMGLRTDMDVTLIIKSHALMTHQADRAGVRPL